MGYKEKYLIEWKGLKVKKSHLVQEYTDEFHKKALMLDIPLYTQETLMKYIGRLLEYAHNIVFMFSPTNLDEVAIQATYIEEGKLGVGVSSESTTRMESKGRGKAKKVNITKKEVENLSCKHCKKEGHDEDHCWQLQPEMKPKWIKKGKQKVVATAKSIDLGSNSSDETQIATLVITGKPHEGNDSNNSKRKLFHIRVVMKHTKIDTLLNSGSQANLILEKAVKKLGLKTIKHHKPNTLIWMKRNHKLRVTEQCMLPFAITSQFKDKVMYDVVKLDTCGMILGSTYLYDRKAIFYRERN